MRPDHLRRTSEDEQEARDQRGKRGEQETLVAKVVERIEENERSDPDADERAQPSRHALVEEDEERAEGDERRHHLADHPEVERAACGVRLEDLGERAVAGAEGASVERLVPPRQPEAEGRGPEGPGGPPSTGS